MNEKRFEDLFDECRERFTLRDTVNLMSLYLKGIIDEFNIEWACYTADAMAAQKNSIDTKEAFENFKEKWRARI